MKDENVIYKRMVQLMRQKEASISSAEIDDIITRINILNWVLQDG